MLGIMFEGQGRLRVDDLPEPAIGMGEVRIATGMSGICGTDLHAFGKPGVEALAPPADVPPGHEICGTIVEVGEGTRTFSVGDRVVGNHIIGCGACETCRKGAPHHCVSRRRTGREVGGSMGQYMVLPERNLFHLPQGMSLVDGTLLACNFGTAYSALKRAGVAGGHRVAVAGLGPVGVCVAMAATGLGGTVVGLELNPERRKLAAEVTGCTVIDPGDGDAAAAVMEFSGGRGVDVAVDVTGVAVAQHLCLEAVRPSGTVVLIGVGGELTISPFAQVIAKDLDIIGSYTYKLGEFDEMVRLVQDAELDLESVVSHVFTPHEAEQAFKEAVGGSPGKVLFDWSTINEQA